LRDVRRFAAARARGGDGRARRINGDAGEPDGRTFAANDCECADGDEFSATHDGDGHSAASSGSADSAGSVDSNRAASSGSAASADGVDTNCAALGGFATCGVACAPACRRRRTDHQRPVISGIESACAVAEFEAGESEHRSRCAAEFPQSRLPAGR